MAEQLLTKLHESVLKYINTVIDKTGFPPTVSDIAVQFDVSRQRAHSLLNQLQKRGVVDWKKGDINTLRITADTVKTLKTNKRAVEGGRKLPIENEVGHSRQLFGSSLEEDGNPVSEYFELLISDEFKLTERIPVKVYRYSDGLTVITSEELNLSGQGDSEYLAKLEFSDVLIEDLEDLEEIGTDKLGRALKIRLSMLKRLLKRI